MLLNRALEAARLLHFPRLLLRKRARARVERPPLILVPGMFGTRLADASGKLLWGSLRALYRGPPVALAEGARPAGLLLGLNLIPGLWQFDVHGGLLRFLQSSGGYRLGEDLHVLDYDWRTGFIDGAKKLDALVAGLRGLGEEKVDLLSISTGGGIVKTWLAHGAADPLAMPAAPNSTGAPCVRRVVFVGCGQRGTFDALSSLHRGFRFAPGGKRFRGEEAALTQTPFDALPHPDERVFLDERGRALDHDLYDPRTWSRLGLLPEVPGLIERLDRARRLHLALSRAAPIADAMVIGARHRPTPIRAIVIGGRAQLPAPNPSARDPYVGFCYAPGDGELPEASLRALPQLPEARIWFAKPAAHSQLPSDPEVHRLILEALLATDRHIPVPPGRGPLHLISTQAQPSNDCSGQA